MWVWHQHRVNKGLVAMSLKKIVNDKEQWDALLEYYDECITLYHKSMEQMDSTAGMYRTQGAIAALRKLKQMRDIVNG